MSDSAAPSIVTALPSEVTRRSDASGSAQNVVISQVTAINNDTFGVFLQGVERIDGSFISSSGHSGVGINIGSDGQTRLTDSTATGNLAGVSIAGPQTTVGHERVTNPFLVPHYGGELA